MDTSFPETDVVLEDLDDILGIIDGGTENKQVTVVNIYETNQGNTVITDQAMDRRNVALVTKHLNKQDAHG